MYYNLSSSQYNFYPVNIEDNLWNQSGIILFKGFYAYEQMNSSLNSIISADDFFRCRFKEVSDKPVTYIDEFSPTDFPYFNFESEEALYEIVAEYKNHSLADRLFEAFVFNLHGNSGFFANFHHLIIDGYSMTVMAEHLNICLNGGTVDSNAVSSYQEYVDVCEKYKNSKRYTTDRTFWSKQFSLNPNCSIFEEKKTSFDYASDEVNFRVAPELYNKIKTYCYNNEISVQSFFNTVYSVYIYKTTGSDFFTLGVPVLNRTTEAELNTIGLYMHIVPLLVRISEDSFLRNAINVEDAQMNLFRHQKFTQYDIKELLKTEGKPQNNLFDIAADYQAFEENEDYEFEFVYSNSLSLPLEIHMQSFGKEKHNLKIRYRTSMFSEKEIQTMLDSFMAIAEDALENPDKKITELEMLSAEEKQKLLCDFNNTKHSYAVAENSTLYSLFEKTASYNKDKICIKTAERNLTFGELLNISESLDTKLRKITGKKKSVIAVIAERSVEMYCAIYGIIRGGNAYLPIDPNYPQERIDRILSDSKAAAVAVQGKFTKLAGNVPVVDMTDFISDCHKESDSEKCAAEPDDTAYVIYTSGSTGNPKGAMVSHSSAVNRILWMHDKYPLGDGDVILQKTPYTFDVSVWELFWWGVCGGSLAASKPDEHFLPAKILDEVKSNKVTHLHFVPSVFEIFLSYLESHTEEQSKFNTVKYVFVSGEALTANLVERFYKLYSYDKVTLHNLYGPTECAVDVTYYDCRPEDVDPVPIGKPIYNTQMYVVDKSMKAVPIGVTGELCIAGVNVGKGYLGRPELTAEKFVDNPFGEGKLYRTGDNAYFREDGQLIFCGRIDSQIKLNGQRIEIGEIESAINEAKGADSAAVIVRKVNSSDVLVAFYTGFADAKDEIKNICMSKLPKYMVPGAFIHLDKLPLNQSGKLDRKALSEMQVDLIFDKEEYAEPTNPTESFICEKFKEVLGIDNIGRNSDFFENGGTSLSMISLLSEKIFEGITAAEFMRNPTPAKLASVMDGKAESKPEYLEVLHIAENSDRVLILLPFAGGGAEAYGKFLDSLKKKDKDFSVYFVRYLHSEEECRKAASEIAGILKGKEISVYSHCVGAAIALRIIKTLEENGTAVKEYFAAAAIPPSRPSEKNMWRAVPDRILEAILSNAGAHIKDLSKAKRRDLLTRFREDTDFANIVYADFEGKIKTPVSVIISKDDIFTKNYRQAEKLWLKYVQNLKGVSFISSESHYFQRDDSDSLSDIILASDK